MKQHFFRQEAVHANLKHLYGNTYAIAAFPYQTFSMVLCALLPISLTFILVAPYTEQYTLRGYLDANQGIARVFPIKSGILSKYSFENGQHVNKGQALCLVKINDSASNKTEQQQIIKQLQQRKSHLLNSFHLKKHYIQTIQPLLLKKYISQSLYQHEIDELLNLEHAITDINQEITRYQHATHYVLHAPISGVITNVVSQKGQQVEPTQAILDIVPDQTILVAKLLIPVTQIGYVHVDDMVSIHYDAYSDKYDQSATGQIKHINQTPSTEFNALMPKHAKSYYKATASLTRSTITMSGQELPLQLGMTCSVVVQGKRKRIWQWIIEPLLRFRHPNFI